MKKNELKEFILEEEKKGKVVLNSLDCYLLADIDDLIGQPIEGLLYDLNRDKATVLTFIDDEKWVNDYAVALVITRLKERLNAVLAEKEGRNE